jgi:hypothetical protein
VQDRGIFLRNIALLDEPREIDVKMSRISASATSYAETHQTLDARLRREPRVNDREKGLSIQVKEDENAVRPPQGPDNFTRSKWQSESGRAAAHDESWKTFKRPDRATR